ncbi:hypothetical protein SNE40_021872 [Patella caerulea]|uniref:Integrase core domain-containing protein n=1 Tax=Patella caerulea TaxID=87958 RepID=A0AAN8G0F7_PATCE
MLLLLHLHQVNISLSTLKRRLRSLRLKRKLTGSRNTISSYNDVVNAIITEIGCSGRCIGHRSMWYRLKIEWGIRFPRDEILRLMRIVDPEGIRVRKRRRLHRRRYICKGPNKVWHVDGYNKIKPFGFWIHGCVDGFSRRIICLQFYFMHIIQSELDMVTRNCNLHQISRSRKTEVPTGNLDAMYFLPQVYDASDQGTFLDIRDVSTCMTIFEYDNKSLASNKFVQLIELLKPGMGIPVTAREGLNLYMEITELLEHYQ